MYISIQKIIYNFLYIWFSDINKIGKPLVLAVVLVLFNFLNSLADLLKYVIIRRFKLFLFLFEIPMMYSIYNSRVFYKFLQVTVTIYFTSSNVLAIFGSKLVSIMILTMVIMLLTSIVFFKNTYFRVLKVLALSIWNLIIVHLSYLVRNLALFLFTSTMTLFYSVD